MHANRKKHYAAESAPMDQMVLGVRAECISVAFRGHLSIVGPCRFALLRFPTQGRFMSATKRADLHTVVQLVAPKLGSE